MGSPGVSEDPSVFVTDLTEEFCVCLRAGLTRQEALQLNRNALQAAFGDRKELQEARCMRLVPSPRVLIGC